MIKGHIFSSQHPDSTDYMQPCNHMEISGEVCGRPALEHAPFADAEQDNSVVIPFPQKPTAGRGANPPPNADDPPIVLHQFRGSLSFLGGGPRSGEISLLSNGYARFVSDDGPPQVVTLIHKSALPDLNRGVN